MINHQQASRIFSFFVFLIAISSIGLVIDRYQSILLFTAFFSAFFCYVWIVKLEKNLQILLLLGIVTRLVLFFDLPHLSDDVFRFLWDGKLISMGINPFQYRPEELMDQMDPELYDLLNSQIHYTVYPPFNQALFWLATVIGDDNYLLGTNFLRAVLFSADIGSLLLLRRLLATANTSKNTAWWYFLNPLVILEFTGNLHFEGLVIFFLLLSLHFISRNKYLVSGLALGMAAATKLLPLIFFPFLSLRFNWKRGFLLGIGGALIFVVSLIPLFNWLSIEGFKDSLLLYSNKFEFNASIYFIIREIGWLLKGYNPIETWGFWISITTTLLILVFSLLASIRKENIYASMLWILLIYLLMATTVHPWYIITLIPLGLLSGYYFPVFWSFLVFLSYIGYQKDGFELSMIWIVVQYVVLFAVIVFEIFQKSRIIKYG